MRLAPPCRPSATVQRADDDQVQRQLALVEARRVDRSDGERRSLRCALIEIGRAERIEAGQLELLEDVRDAVGEQRRGAAHHMQVQVGFGGVPCIADEADELALAQHRPLLHPRPHRSRLHVGIKRGSKGAQPVLQDRDSRHCGASADDIQLSVSGAPPPPASPSRGEPGHGGPVHPRRGGKLGPARLTTTTASWERTQPPPETQQPGRPLCSAVTSLPIAPRGNSSTVTRLSRARISLAAGCHAHGFPSLPASVCWPPCPRRHRCRCSPHPAPPSHPVACPTAVVVGATAADVPPPPAFAFPIRALAVWVGTERETLWGGWIELANGWRLEPPDLAADSRLPLTVEARKLATAE